jgi:hypothetical protein
MLFYDVLTSLIKSMFTQKPLLCFFAHQIPVQRYGDPQKSALLKYNTTIKFSFRENDGKDRIFPVTHCEQHFWYLLEFPPYSVF